MYAVMAQQRGANLIGKGSDQYGDFNITGLLTGQNNIELHKVYPGVTDPKKPIILIGKFQLGAEPLYASGRWQFKYNVGKFLHARTQIDGGSWEMNVYPNPAYRVKKQNADGSVTTVESAYVPPTEFPNPVSWFIHLDMNQKGMFGAGLVLHYRRRSFSSAHCSSSVRQAG